MMTNEMINLAVYEKGRADALSLQSRVGEMTGTELNAETNVIPSFKKALEVMNMLERPIGFVCKSSAGRVVKLVQPYDSTIYTAEPEELTAQWGFKWSTDPAKALPFVAISTSPYMIGDCCIENEIVYRSLIDNNTFNPSTYSLGWEVVTKV
jgi:hypothetical protein